MRSSFYFAFLMILCCISCTSSSTDTNSTDVDDSGYTTTESSCGYDDGTYSATVEYNNPETGFSNTYTLDVEVENCQVVQINFDNGGWLDEDHISPADIDSNGTAFVEGEDGKSYGVQL